jgi:phage shock protein PspC (stress-responsive transcriptional regulator)
MGAIHNIDYSGSVLEIQERLARVRRAYIIGGIVGGLTWWFLWVPVLMVLLALVHVNLYADAPSVIWSGLAVGVVGLAGMLWVYAYSRKPGRDGLRRFVDQAVVGRSLLRAQSQLDEVRRFAQEAA